RLFCFTVLSGYLYLPLAKGGLSYAPLRAHHLLLNFGIARTQRLDLCIGKRLLVHIVAGAHWGLGGHNLRNKPLLLLQSLIEVRVEGRFRHILEYLHFLVLIALTDDSAVALSHIRRPPAHVQMMERHQTVLTVGASAHLLGAAQQDPHLS